MTALLDTHFILWVLAGAKRLRAFPWLDSYLPWGLSPVSFLEIQFLAEVGKVRLMNRFFETLRSDPRFVLDELPLDALIQHALRLGWTRDPFDRLIVAHSDARRIPLCTVDDNVRRHHRLLVAELRG